MDRQLQDLQRAAFADPRDRWQQFALVLRLKRQSHTFIEEALAALQAGVPLGSQGLRRQWFKDYWSEVPYRVNRRIAPKLEAGPFATLRGADLFEAELNGRDLRAASFRFANLDGAYLANADLSHACLQHASLNGANLIRARLRGADLSHTELTRCDLIYADLRGANLRGATLDLANLRGALLKGADFRGARLVQTYIEPWSMTELDRKSVV